MLGKVPRRYHTAFKVNQMVGSANTASSTLLSNLKPRCMSNYLFEDLNNQTPIAFAFNRTQRILFPFLCNIAI